MEKRKVLIANTKTQQRNELLTDASTLRELKAAMSEAGIDYSGMDFTEGITKTQLISDDSLLPTNVMHKGEPTNDLVMLLTNTTKNISSGCEERTRKEAYAIIKEQGDWFKDAIRREFGANYTLITTENLWLFIDENLEEKEDEELDELDDEEDENKEPQEYIPTPQDVANYITSLTKALAKTGALGYKEVASIAERLEELANILKELNTKSYDFGGGKISDDDIDDMIASI
jgi:hypothetical protein